MKPVFRNRLPQYLKDHRLSIADASREMGISRDTLHRLKNGDVQRMDAVTVGNIAKYFGVPFERIFYIEWIDE